MSRVPPTAGGGGGRRGGAPPPAKHARVAAVVDLTAESSEDEDEEDEECEEQDEDDENEVEFMEDDDADDTLTMQLSSGQVMMGNSPPGTMSVHTSSNSRYIVITYMIPPGTQTAMHPHPGVPFQGTTRVAYLPNTPDGREMVRLLRRAFNQRLTFTVGQSLTTGADNVITWAAIPHKTSLSPGPFGYPDPLYLPELRQILALYDIRGSNSAGMAAAAAAAAAVTTTTVVPPTTMPLPVPSTTMNIDEFLAPMGSKAGEELVCTICRDDVLKDEGVTLTCTCSIVLHRACALQSLRHKAECPQCRHVFSLRMGSSPPGTMTWHTNNHAQLPGFPKGSGIITIFYDIPSGQQSTNHPNPGMHFYGTQREAYLPNTQEGQEILSLLKRAFDQRLTFTVGRSLTTGADNVVTWASIHHKTSMHGGSFGYPDPTYFARLRDELKQYGIN